MALGLAGTFGSDTKMKKNMWTFNGVALNVFSKFLSGVVSLEPLHQKIWERCYIH